MTPVPITAARELGQRAGCLGLVVIAVDPASGDCSVTTWGKTRRECGKLKAYAEAGGFQGVAEAIAEVIE